MTDNLLMYVDGQWVTSQGDERFVVTSPVTGLTVATIPSGTRDDARRAIAAARRAQGRWAATSVAERARICRRIADIAERRRDELAHLLTLEQGKPYHSEAQREAGAVPLWFRMAAEHVMAISPYAEPAETADKRVLLVRQPRGTYAVITPWNYPLGIPSEFLSAAFVTGNAVVWVPAPTTSACAVQLVACLAEAGVPEGVVNLVTGDGPVVGDEIVANPGTDAVAFTGSSATGLRIAERAAGKPLLLELGGNGPTIVLPDADIERAARAIATGCYFNAGQVCAATGRILVHRAVHDELTARLVDETSKVRLGDPFDPHTTMGPLNNERTATKVDEHLGDAVARGARILTGGSRAPGMPTSLYYLPTVVDDAPSDSRLHLEETFGPVAPLTVCDDEEAALRYADASSLGLAGAIFTRDIRKGLLLAEKLRLGLVNINDRSSYWDRRIPSGGAAGKRSGVGRHGGKYTLLEMTDLKAIVIDVS